VRPETIENRWDILYRDYPDVYDEFASFPYSPAPVDVLAARFTLGGKTVADIGSGSGRSTFALAKHAGRVIGVEPESAMIAVARNAARQLDLAERVRFVKGDRQRIPLDDGSVDLVTSLTAGVDVQEALRVVRRGGTVIVMDVAPGWYGGDLRDVVALPAPGLEELDERLHTHGFDSFDFDAVQDYGTTENIVRTYGFVFGWKAIAHLRTTGRTSVRWHFRVWHRQA
jgi:SAM-dependent methyltransferase